MAEYYSDNEESNTQFVTSAGRGSHQRSRPRVGYGQRDKNPLSNRHPESRGRPLNQQGENPLFYRQPKSFSRGRDGPGGQTRSTRRNQRAPTANFSSAPLDPCSRGGNRTQRTFTNERNYSHVKNSRDWKDSDHVERRYEDSPERDTATSRSSENRTQRTYTNDRNGSHHKKNRDWKDSDHMERRHEYNPERDTATSGSRKRERRKREHPMGYKALESMLDLYPDQVVLKLLMENSGYDLLIGDYDSISDDKMRLLMQVLCHASKSQVNRENLNTLFVNTFTGKFINHLIKFCMVISFQDTNDHEQISKYFEDLSSVLHTYAHTMPTRAVDHLVPLIDSSIMICQRFSFLEIMRKNEEIKTFLENERLKVEQKHTKQGRTHKARWEENLPPPNNFRDLSVIPTSQDINDVDRPFLRENITQGYYKDVDHYLDVQFRLLREDFVRPLRKGIQEFRLNTHSKNTDIRIYKDVQVVGTDIKNGELIHYVKISFNKKLKIENSKRLLYGNLLCFTTDNFKTLVLGSVAERNVEDLKKGKLGVKFESDVTNQGELWVMAESRAYFMAYKHVLGALQEITNDSFPLQEFIINVTQEKIYPMYLSRQTSYDLQVLKNPKMMKISEAYNQLFREGDQIHEYHFTPHPRLQNVRIMENIEFWPSVNDLGLDESQFRAFRSALTSKLAIIQGPPGTGKTFIGLKIAQTLLHNSDVWKHNEQLPILVVCFTNHALDQFLEGIAKFTKSIVRVGSRTKSEVVSDFQIRTLINGVKRRRQMPNDVHELNQTRYQDAVAAEREVRQWKSALEETGNPQGILRKHVFLKEKVMADNVARQVESISLTSWLMDTSVLRDKRTFGNITLDNPKVTTETQEEYDDEYWYDAEDLIADEENERMVDKEDSADKLKHATPRGILDYEMNVNSLEKELLRVRPEDIAEMDLGQQAMYEEMAERLKENLNILKFGFRTMAQNSNTELERIENQLNIMTLSFQNRWLLYKIWLQRLHEKVKGKFEIAEKEFRRCSKALEEIRCQEMLHVMRHAAVVGMTTTGAAQNTTVLQALQPSIGKGPSPLLLMVVSPH